MGAVDFAKSMEEAMKAKNEAENQLADLVAESAIGSVNEDELEDARRMHSAAEERLRVLFEEASLYAERAAEATKRLEGMSQELAKEQRLREDAERRNEDFVAVVAEARHSAALRTAELEAREKNGHEVQKREEARNEELRTLLQGASRAEESKKAAEAAATAAVALLALERQSNTNELVRARTVAEAAQSALSEARRSTELELSEARRESEVHRQRRLAARSELVTVAKALEAQRSEARNTETTLEKDLVPRLLRHSTVIGTLVERANAAAISLAGGPEHISTSRRRSDTLQGKSTSFYGESPDSAFPTKYLGDLAHEIHRIESGLDLLSQSLDLIDDTVEAHTAKDGSCLAYFRALLALGSFPKGSSHTNTAGRRIRFAASVVSTPRSRKAGYSRVRLESPLEAPYDDDQVL